MQLILSLTVLYTNSVSCGFWTYSFLAVKVHVTSHKAHQKEAAKEKQKSIFTATLLQK